MKSRLAIAMFGLLLSCGRANSANPSALGAPAQDAAPPSDAPAGDDSGSPSRSTSVDISGLCPRPAADAIHDRFCSAGPVVVRGLFDLERILGLGAAADASSGSLPAAVLLGHSTALFGRLVSPVNPRAVLLGQPTLLAFHRGVQEVELASRDRETTVFNLYLVTFAQACNDASGGCSPGDLFTPTIESNWTRVQIRDAEDLKDTPLDCRQCHQRDRATPILLMRELEGPWTHFFDPPQAPSDRTSPAYPEATGSDLLADYLQAKGDEEYAGLPTSTLEQTAGILLQGAVPPDQPLKFDGVTILNERWPYDPAGGYPSAPHRSATWYAAYGAFKRGEELALPYFDPRPTDPTKQAALSAAYQRYRSGALAARDLPDLADIYPDDPQVRSEIGLQTEPGATPAQTLIQACAQCHNDVLDQSISRARFTVALSGMNRSELDVAIARLAPSAGAGAMPPPVTRQLDPNARAALVEYLRGDVRSADDDALLERAARLGMTGGAPGQP